MTFFRKGLIAFRAEHRKLGSPGAVLVSVTPYQPLEEAGRVAERERSCLEIRLNSGQATSSQPLRVT